LNKPKVPTKIFSNEELALQWFDTFRKKSGNRQNNSPGSLCL
jgi:hypothetical protein